MADENSNNVDSKTDSLTLKKRFYQAPVICCRNIARHIWTGNRNLLITVLALLLVVTAALAFWSGQRASQLKQASILNDHHNEHSNNNVAEIGSLANEVALSTAALEAEGIEVEVVKSESISKSTRVTGSIEADQEQLQQATPLVSGRVERVIAGLGDQVKAGSILAMIASPQIAQLHGKLHEAETKLSLAERNLLRVEKSENRVAVLSAKARLDEADQTLRRTRQLTDLGITASKDLITAETAYKTAKAEFEFQSNIALNREVQEARAAVETARVDVQHSMDELRAYGAPVVKGEDADHHHNTALISLRAPINGTVIERTINAGAGIEAGKPLFTIANLSNVWVIANVPESQINQIRLGTSATIQSTAATETKLIGKVTYINPILNEETRTTAVRVEVANPQQRVKIGTFVEVIFETTPAGEKSGEEIVIPESAIQRIAEQSVVFIPQQNKTGYFEVREIEVGGEASIGMRRVTAGLTAGERVVTKGSFTLKTQLRKGEMGSHNH